MALILYYRGQQIDICDQRLLYVFHSSSYALTHWYFIIDEFNDPLAYLCIVEALETWCSNPRMHLLHIPQCFIQNRNVHISVLNGALWGMQQVHSGIFELGQLDSGQFYPRPVLDTLDTIAPNDCWKSWRKKNQLASIPFTPLPFHGA